MANLTFNGQRLLFPVSGGIGGILNFIPSLLINDWFLPSLDELNQMYINLHQEGVGGFNTNGYYWTSSEYSTFFAWKQTFDGGNQIRTQTKAGSKSRVRSCRTFTDSIGAYSLRDTGPGTGLIFYIDGTTYYESAPYDQTGTVLDDLAYWCDNDLGGTILGASGTAIGTGKSNTTTMINYSGYGDSGWLVAAKLSDDLIISL
jgi:hypothetical protein